MRKLLAQWQTLDMAEKISGKQRIEARGEVITDFEMFLERGRFIFLGFLFGDVYSIDRVFFTRPGRLDDEGRGSVLNRAKVRYLRLPGRFQGRETNTVTRRISVQLTVAPRQKDKQAKKKLNDDLFHQTANLDKVAYPGKYLFYPGKYLFVWYSKRTRFSSLFLFRFWLSNCRHCSSNATHKNKVA
jgi:hypothetical protein